MTGDSVSELTRIVHMNQNLEKLAMQHNRFGEGDLKEFSKVLSEHKSLKYIDISANQIRNRAFEKIFTAI